MATSDELQHLLERADRSMSVAIALSSQLADIAELVGLERDAEDLDIVPAVRELVSDPRVQLVLGEIRKRREETLRATRARFLAGVRSNE